MTEGQLTMTFDPNTIEHLGVRLYTTLPPVISELIANAYDADADWVKITLVDKDDEKKITVEDNGIGMSFQDIDDKFLHIGRNRRVEDGTDKSTAGRKVIGKKGLGKLSFFGIAHRIEISTKKDGKENVFVMSWEGIKKEKNEYHPEISKKDEKCDKKEHGTVILLTNIQRESDFSSEQLARSLSKIFIIDADFEIIIHHNDEKPIKVDNDRKFAELDKDIEWAIPKDSEYESDYARKDEITGYLLTTEKPISPSTNMRGIVLFSRKKLVNLPEYFSESTSSHFFSYLTGWLEVDFIDDLEDDVIATNRQSLNWDHPEIKELRAYLQGLLGWLQADWRVKRAEGRKKKLTKATGINISDWFDKLPDDIKKHVEPVVQAIIKESELPDESNIKAVASVYAIAPEYPKFHWRHLHPDIQEITKDDYADEKYFDAAEKASRLYIQRSKDKSQIDSGSDSNDMDTIYNPGSGKLKVTNCSDTTERNIQNGQQMLSKGVVVGCRNPLTHNPEYQIKLVETGLFTEKDCLDLLSIISHLFFRLDNANLRNDESVQ